MLRPTVALVMIAAGPALGDATALCVERATASRAQCDCATQSLRDAVDPETLALFDAVAGSALRFRADGLSRRLAWEEGIVAVATERGLGITDLLNRMNPVDRTHRAAIEACAG